MYNEREEDRRRSNKSLIVVGVMLSISAVLLIISFIDPVLLIGFIWDWDIQNQISDANDRAVKNNQETVSFRITYDNNDSTEIRIERAIQVFNEFFSENEKSSEVVRNEDTTQLILRWQV